MLFQQYSKATSRPLTYISLFSSAGVGCYGFKQANFQCIATNEIVPRRLDVQKFNNKCKYESGYICGDITDERVKSSIYEQIDLWKTWEMVEDVDVVIATPPCQGMSVANHKKSSDEIVRNSLVIESIKLVLNIKPKVFIFENVPAFMKTICTDTDNIEKSIQSAIQRNLGKEYSYVWEVINFKDYGACSSRSRTVVIGIRKDIADDISPYDIFPRRKRVRTLRNVIGHFPRLTQMGEIQADDIYHSFRAYPEHMREWIRHLKEGESAFDQEEIDRIPHQIIEGKRVENARKNGDKYRRQTWDKVGPCVHTRNDQLASQNTIHPEDDRVFSIRELMSLMTVPFDFKWSRHELKELNALSLYEKKAFLKKEEIKIRQSLGEAVPTVIFHDIAIQLKEILEKQRLTEKEASDFILKKNLTSKRELINFIHRNAERYSLSSLMRLSELANTKRTENSAYYTNKSIITEIIKRLPSTQEKTIRILEPSVGVGAFIPYIARRFASHEVFIDVVDIDADSLDIFQTMLEHMNLPSNVHVNIICDDFLLHTFSEAYDYVIGNPPFGNVSKQSKDLTLYIKQACNKNTKNIFSFFLDKCYTIAETVALVLPKSVLNAPEFAVSRSRLSDGCIHSILDFGECGFKGVLVETVCIICSGAGNARNTTIFNMIESDELIQKQSYITDSFYPYWLLYRNSFFDSISKKLKFNCFTVFRDRQITNSQLNANTGVRVLKSRNISDDGKEIRDIEGYDSYISLHLAQKLAVYKYINDENIYMTPNMTYKPRVMQKPKGLIVNGSVALLFPRKGIEVTNSQLEYFSSDEYRQFYRIARNKQTRSLNIDSCSVFFLGLLQPVTIKHNSWTL